jgi:hypothetical protein
MSCSSCSNTSNISNINNQNVLTQCQVDAYGYANRQNTFYNRKKDEIQYGRSNLMQASGVSDGTCNQINPSMLVYQNRCGVGAAGGNPCFPDTVEPFQQNESQGCNIGGFVTLLFLILILLLFININYYENQ